MSVCLSVNQSINQYFFCLSHLKISPSLRLRFALHTRLRPHPPERERHRSREKSPRPSSPSSSTQSSKPTGMRAWSMAPPPLYLLPYTGPGAPPASPSCHGPVPPRPAQPTNTSSSLMYVGRVGQFPQGRAEHCTAWPWPENGPQHGWRASTTSLTYLDEMKSCLRAYLPDASLRPSECGMACR